MTKGMVNVELKNGWFDPQSKYWEPGRYEMVEGLIEFLPTSALILDEDGSVDEAAMEDKRARERGEDVAAKKAEENKVKPDNTVSSTALKK